MTNDSDANSSSVYLLGETLRAEVGLVGYASQSWSTGGSGHVSAFPNAWNLPYACTPRPLADPAQPAFIVTNNGINDATDHTALVTPMLNTLLTSYANSAIFVVEPYDGKWGDQLTTAVTPPHRKPATALHRNRSVAHTPDVTDGRHNSGYINLVGIAPKLASAVSAALDTTGEAGASRWIKKTAGLVQLD